MTDLKPGSRWMLPVTLEEFDEGDGAFMFEHDNGAFIWLLRHSVKTLIPADRITELEAEVKRLREEILRARD